MPLLTIETNVAINIDRRLSVLKRCSESVAEMLGKPERYVMIKLEADHCMLFAGDDRPLARLQLKSLGLPGNRTAEFSDQLCRLIEHELSIPRERIYIEFSDPPRNMWGWNGGTF